MRPAAHLCNNFTMKDGTYMWLLVLLVIGSSTSSVNAWRHFMKSIPNGQYVPCPDVPEPWLSTKPSRSPGCLGGYCEALGHDGCSPEAEINEFGEMFAHPGEGAHEAWTVEVCAADNDSDGYTNGDELGDGCCTWDGGESSLFLVADRRYVTNPTSDVSLPSSPSCTTGGSPSVPTNVLIAALSSSQITVSWDPSEASCVCGYAVVITGPGLSFLKEVRGDQRSIILCNLNAGTQYTVTVTAYNRADGDNGASMPAVVTTPVSGSKVPADCVQVDDEDEHVTSLLRHYVDTIPLRGGSMRRTIPATRGEALLLTVCIPLALLALIAFIYRTSCKRGQAWGIYGNLCCSCCLHPAILRFSWTRDFSFLTGSSLLVFTVSLVSLGALWILVWLYYATSMLYSPAQVAGYVYRSCGFVLACCMGLQLVPVTRWSFWMHTLGVSFDRGVIFHRWISTFGVCLAAIHGFGLAYEYSQSPLGLSYLFRWSKGDLPVNPLAGTVVGIATVVLAITAWGPVRRRCYEVFLCGHALYPLILGLSIVHTRISETRVLVALGPGIALLVFDHVMLILDCWLRPVRLLEAKPLIERNATTATFIKICAVKSSKWAWLNWIWPFKYNAGQFVYMCVPAISMYPHPFSISSEYNPARPGYFTLHIRNHGGASYSASLTILGHMLAESNVSHPTREDIPVQYSNRMPPRRDVNELKHSISISRHNSSTRQCAAEHSKLPLILWVSGPFGVCSLDLQRYDHYILFAGGIGITPILTTTMELQRKNVDQASLVAADGQISTVKKIVTAWAVRESCLIEEMAAQIPEFPDPADGPVDPSKLATSLVVFSKERPSAKVSHSYFLATDFDDVPAPPPPGLSFVKARFAAGLLMQSALQGFSLRESGKTDVAILVCGPSGLMDDVYRAAASINGQKETPFRLHIHKEIFEF